MMEFEQFYQQYNKSVYLYIRRRINDNELAEDITAETFFKLFSLWDNLEKDNEKKLLSWVYTTARNRMIDEIRKMKKTTNMNMEIEIKDEENVYDDIIHELDMNQDLQKVYKAMSQISGEKREILELRFKQELKIHEIAEVVGKKEGAVKMMLYRTLKELNTMID